MLLQSLQCFIAVVIFALSVGVSAVFQDEAFVDDYHHSLLGDSQAGNTFFHKPDPASRASLLYAISDVGVVGAVHPKDGQLLWRKHIGESDEILSSKSFLKADAETIIAAHGQMLAVLNSADGRQLWSVKRNGQIQSVESQRSIDGSHRVLLLSKSNNQLGSVTCLSAQDGTEHWTHTGKSGSESIRIFSIADRAFVVDIVQSKHKTFKLIVTEIHSETGSTLKAYHSSVEVSSLDRLLYVGGIGGRPFLLWTDDSLSTIKVEAIEGGHVSELAIATSKTIVGRSVSIHHSPDMKRADFLVQVQDQFSSFGMMCNIDLATSKARITYETPVEAGNSIFSAASFGDSILFVHYSPQLITLRSVVDSSPLSTWNTSTDLEVSEFRYAVSEVALKPPSSYSLRSTIRLRSGDLILTKNEKILWQRPESLDGILDVIIAKPMTQDKSHLGMEMNSASFSAPFNRLSRQFRRVKTYLRSVFNARSELRALMSGVSITNQKHDASRAHQNHQILAIIVTKQGRAAAIDMNSRGKIIWNVQIAQPCTSAYRYNETRIVANNSTVWISMEGNETIKLDLMDGRELSRAPASASTFDTKSSSSHSGKFKEILNKAEPPEGIEQDLSSKSTPFTTRIPVTFSEKQGLRGWLHGPVGDTKLLWQFNPVAGDLVHSAKYNEAETRVASIGKALGDRNVLYKYLNPNLLLVTTTNLNIATATVYLLDAITGRIMFTNSFHNVDHTQPIRTLISENFIAISLCSNMSLEGRSSRDTIPSLGCQLTTVELFESHKSNDRGHLEANTNFSSFGSPEDSSRSGTRLPHPIESTFLISEPLSSMEVTSTAQSITPRSLLCTLHHSNALMAIPRYMLDPRRPSGRDATPAEMEESLFRYSPYLEFDPRWYLSHTREFLSLTHVLSAASLYESTTLVLAWDEHDIFGTHARPIGAFDMLGKSFNKIQLISTVLVLGVCTLVLAPLIRKKQVDRSWGL